MPKITKKETLVLSSEEAIHLIRNAYPKPRFAVKCAPWLPTDENRGFEGCTFVTISRADAIKVVKDCLRSFEARGAKIRIHTDPPHCTGAGCYISIY